MLVKSLSFNSKNSQSKGSGSLNQTHAKNIKKDFQMQQFSDQRGTSLKQLQMKQMLDNSLKSIQLRSYFEVANSTLNKVADNEVIQREALGEIVEKERGNIKLQLFDNGKRIYAMQDEREVAYLTYEKEDNGGVNDPALRFGYINVQGVAKKKNLSKMLLYFLAKKAMTLDIKVIRVGHPDPSMKGYWESIGFDYSKGQQLSYLRNLENYGEDAMADRTKDDEIITEADSKTSDVLKWGYGYISAWNHV